MRPYSLLSLFAIFLFGCTGTNLKLPQVKLTDYTFETTPNELDNVGFVFAVDDNKMQIPVIMLDLRPIEGTVVVPKKTSTKQMTIGALLKFLGLKNLTASAGLSNTTKVETTFSLENPRISRAFLTRLDSAIVEKKSIISQALISQNLQNAKVYVVFETIKSSKLTYDFSKSKLGGATLDVAFKDIASTNDSLKWNNKGSGSLSYDLKKDLNVFYKIFKIQVMPGASGMDIKRGELVPEPESLYTSRR